jgi:hypothetical protein
LCNLSVVFQSSQDSYLPVASRVDWNSQYGVELKGDSGRTGNMRRTGTLKIHYCFGTYLFNVAFFYVTLRPCFDME